MELLGAFTSSNGSYTVAGDRGADHCIRETPLVVEWSDQSRGWYRFSSKHLASTFTSIWHWLDIPHIRLATVLTFPLKSDNNSKSTHSGLTMQSLLTWFLSNVEFDWNVYNYIHWPMLSPLPRKFASHSLKLIEVIDLLNELFDMVVHSSRTPSRVSIAFPSMNMVVQRKISDLERDHV